VVTPTGVVVLTDRRLAAGPLPAVVAAAVAGGAEWVILRERDLRYAERRALAGALRPLLPPGQLIVAGPDPLGGDAVHLAAADPLPVIRSMSHQWSAPVAQHGRIVGRSCHGVGEVRRLSGETYVTLSPVFPTTTKPGYGPALGARGAAELGSPVPWLALGGVDSAERAAECAAAGAAGIAVLGAVMRATDPARVVRELAAAFAGGSSSGVTRQGGVARQRGGTG
jgi:thiamine-phosphate pyrophosphorylase